MRDSEISVDFILGIILFIFIFGAIFFGVIDENKYIYECTDYKGDIIYCTYARETKGGMFGKTENGVEIQLTSYKRILKSEIKEEKK